MKINLSINYLINWELYYLCVKMMLQAFYWFSRKRLNITENLLTGIYSINPNKQNLFLK